MTASKQQTKLCVDLDGIVGWRCVQLLAQWAPCPDTVDAVRFGAETLYRGELDDAIKTVRSKHGERFEIFLDLRLHDEPETMEKAVRAVRYRHPDSRVDYLSIHCSAGQSALGLCVEASVAEDPGVEIPTLKLIGVACPPHFTQHDLLEVGIHPEDARIEGRPYVRMPGGLLREMTGTEPLTCHATRLALLGAREGLYGVLCSARDNSAIRDAKPFSTGMREPGELFLVNPDIWNVGTGWDSRHHPDLAVGTGAGMIVMGTGLTAATALIEMAQRIKRQITSDVP